MHKVLSRSVALMLAACGGHDTHADAPGDRAARTEVRTDTGMGVTVGEGFVRPAVAGAASTAAYFTIMTDEADRLTGAGADGFAAVEIHTVTEEGGVSRMRRIDGIDVVPGRLTALRPGGEHLMMMGPDRALEPGDTVTVTLTFESGAEAEVALPVRRPGADADPHGGMSH